MSVFGPIITPDEVVDLLVAVARHADGTTRRQHLAALAAKKGLARVRDFRTVGVLGDDDDRRQPEEWLPSLLLYDAGTAEPPELDEDRQLDFRWLIGAEVGYLGQGRNPRDDARRGARWYAMAAAQLLLQRTPRNGIVQSLRLTDFEPQPTIARNVATVRLAFEATVGASLAMSGPLPIDPADPTPVEIPADWPAVTVASAHSTVEKEPIP